MKPARASGALSPVKTMFLLSFTHLKEGAAVPNDNIAPQDASAWTT